MRFYNQPPYGYTGHNTGGEHVMKHYNDPRDIDALRHNHNPALDRWNPDEVRDVMREAGTAGELVNAYLDDDGLPLVGGSLVRYKYPSDFAKRMVLDASDIIVAPEHRGKTIGSYLLSKPMILQQYGATTRYPSEMVITDRNKLMDSTSYTRLAAAGFTRKDENGNPRMLLAGTSANFRINDAGGYQQSLTHMPTGWNGYLKVEEGAQFSHPDGSHAFRDGQFIGVAQPIDGVEYDDDDRMFRTYNYYDAANQLIAANVPQPTDEFYAVSDLVNRLAEK